MLPEIATATDYIFPQSRLAFVHGHGSAPAQRSARQLRRNALLIERMSRFMQGREQALAQIVCVGARRDADIGVGELCAERMRRGVEAPVLEVIAEISRNLETELELCPLRKRAVQAAVVCGRLIGDGGDERYKLAAQLVKERAYGCAGQSFIDVVDQRIGHVLVWREELDIFPRELERLFEIRPHAREVVVRACIAPRAVGSR